MIKNTKHFLITLTVGLSLFLTVFYFTPSNVYFNNINSLPYRYWETLPYLLGVPMVLSFFYALIVHRVKESVLNKILAITVAIAVLFWFQGNFLLRNLELLDGRQWVDENIVLHAIIDITLWTCVILVSFIFSAKVLRFLPLIALVLIIQQSIVLGIAAANVEGRPRWAFDYNFSQAGRFDVSKESNIFIIVLDSYSSIVFDYITSNNEEYKYIFRDFTYFRDAMGGFPTTPASVPFMFAGKQYDNSQNFFEFERDAFEGNSLPRVLKENGYIVNMHSVVWRPYISPTVYSNVIERSAGIITRSQITSLYDIAFLRQMPSMFKPFFHDRNRVLEDDMIRGAIRVAESDLIFFNSLKENMALVHDEKVLKIYPLYGLHQPFVLTEDLSIRNELRFDEDAMLEAAKAQLKLLSGFFDKLRELNIYDCSIIVILADHGTRRQNDNFIYTMDASYSNHSFASPGVVRAIRGADPLFLIKRANEVNPEMVISEAQVQISDLPQTIFYLLGMDIEGPGQSVFSIDPNINRARRFFFYEELRGDNWLRGYFPDMTVFEINGNSRISASWAPTFEVLMPGRVEVRTPPPLYIFGESVNLNIDDEHTHVVIGIGTSVREDSPDIFWSVGNSAAIKIPVNKTDSSLTISLDAWSLFGDYQRVNLYINNTFVAEWLFYGQASVQTAVIPGDLISDGFLRIYMEFPDSETPYERQINADTRLLAIYINEMIISEN